jgi:hypothetical protein
MAPVPIEECRDSDLRDTLEHFVKTLGVDPAGRVDLGLKRLVAHMADRPGRGTAG